MNFFTFFLLFACSLSLALDYAPENTTLLSDAQMREKIAEYGKRRVTVVQGLIQDLQRAEDTQVKKILDFLGLNTEQVFDEIQSLKNNYHELKPVNSNVPQAENLSDKVKRKIVQEANALGIDHRTLIIKRIDEEKDPDLYGSTYLPIEIEIIISKGNLAILNKRRSTYPKIELNDIPVMREMTLIHELCHASNGHGITKHIISLLYNDVSKKKAISEDDYKKLENNYALSCENFAEQYAILRMSLSGEKPLNLLRYLVQKENPTVFERPDSDHISLHEEYVAAQNITNLLCAEKKYNYLKSRINPQLSQIKSTGLNEILQEASDCSK